MELGEMISILIFRTRYLSPLQARQAGKQAGMERVEKLSEMWRPAGGQLSSFFYYYSIAISYSECTFTVVIPVFMYTYYASVLLSRQGYRTGQHDVRATRRRSSVQAWPHVVIYLQCPFTDIFPGCSTL